MAVMRVSYNFVNVYTNSCKCLLTVYTNVAANNNKSSAVAEMGDWEKVLETRCHPSGISPSTEEGQGTT